MFGKYLSILFVGLVFIQLSACNSKKACEHQYDSEIISEAAYYSEGEIIKTCIFCDNKITETIPKLEVPLEVAVTGIDTYEQKRDPLVMPDGMEIFQPPIFWIVFEMDVENVSDIDIESFSGKITIQDNDRQLRVSGTFNEEIGAGETVHLSEYGFEVSYNDLTMADNMLIGKTIEDIQIEFTLDSVK